jgi:hypothetical protein
MGHKMIYGQLSGRLTEKFGILENGSQTQSTASEAGVFMIYGQLSGRFHDIICGQLSGCFHDLRPVKQAFS